MLKVTVALMALLSAGAAFAQDDLPRKSALFLDVRATRPGGEATSGRSWDELLATGFGVEIGYQHFWDLTPKMRVGFYGALSTDDFHGKQTTITDQASGAKLSVDPESMSMYGLEVGGRLRVDAGSVFAEGTMGVGLTIYQSVDATVKGPGGTATLEAIDSSNGILFTVGARGGIHLSPVVDVVLGVAFRLNGAPKVGSGFTGFEFKDQENLVVSLGLAFNF